VLGAFQRKNSISEAHIVVVILSSGVPALRSGFPTTEKQWSLFATEKKVRNIRCLLYHGGRKAKVLLYFERPLKKFNRAF